MNAFQAGKIPVQIQEWITTSERNQAAANTAKENLVTGKITINEFRAIIVDVLNSYLNMKAQLEEYISCSKGEVKKQAKSSLKDNKNVIKSMRKIISLIDKGEVFEE